MFRGHSDSSWKLIPTAGRPPFDEVCDKAVFEAWRRRAIEYVADSNLTDWDWLAIAQHHGLATRLLDWSANPLNAAYFVVRKSRDCTAAIYAVRPKFEISPEQTGPHTYERVARFLPKGITARIGRQHGLFTIQGDPTKPIDEFDGYFSGFDTILISQEYRDTLRRELSYYGIHSASLFPDLDGLSEFVNWAVESREYFC